MSKTTGSFPVTVADTARQTSADSRVHPGQCLAVEVLGERPQSVESERTSAEQVVLDPQVLDVGAALATAGEHQHRLHEHLAPVV